MSEANDKGFFERLAEFEEGHPFTGPGSRTVRSSPDGYVQVTNESRVPDVRELLAQPGDVRVLAGGASGVITLTGHASGMVVKVPPPDVRVFHADTLAKLRRRLAEYPEERFGLDDRRFEELVAYLYEEEGYEVHLTKQTRDGGKDVIASISMPHGVVSLALECKRYSANRRVGEREVRSLVGVVASRFTQGVLVTTSSFSQPAKDYAKEREYILSLKDGEELMKLIRGRQ